MAKFVQKPRPPENIEAFVIRGYVPNSKRAILDGYTENKDYFLTDTQIGYMNAVHQTHKPMWGIIREDQLEVVVDSYFVNNGYRRET